MCGWFNELVCDERSLRFERRLGESEKVTGRSRTECVWLGLFRKKPGRDEPLETGHVQLVLVHHKRVSTLTVHNTVSAQDAAEKRNMALQSRPGPLRYLALPQVLRQPCRRNRAVRTNQEADQQSTATCPRHHQLAIFGARENQRRRAVSLGQSSKGP